LAIQVLLNHRTHYRYDRPVTLGPQVVRLRPAPHCRTPILSYSLRVKPEKHFINWQQDPQSNYLARLVFPDKTTEFLVEVNLLAELPVINPFDFFLEPYAEKFPFEYGPDVAKDLEPYRSPLPAGPLLRRFLDTIDLTPKATNNFMVAINQRLQHDIRYLIRLDPGIQTCEETLGNRSGSCRDSAWLLVQILRHLGLAARFVSGYLIQLTPDVKPIEGPAGTSTDFTDLHAWTEVYLPGAGWIGFDPTSGLLAGEGHIPLACTPEASSAAPITGVVESAKVDFSFSMTVQRVNETPRVTKPYTEDQWTRVTTVARKVDADLVSEDVRLTMGGEPTFVGIDDPDSPEWNSDALGPEKRQRGVTLIRRLQKKFARGALLHFGQGKWYPGEPLPRWSLGCYWRLDGVPIWEDHELIAVDDRDYKYTAADALRYLEALTQRLEVPARNIMAAYEDPFYHLWRQRKLPVNVDFSDSKISNPQERARLVRIFEEGIGNPVGYVIPLRRRKSKDGWFWSSHPWFVRPEKLLLVEGDSPLGYRLPLDSLPWVAPEDVEYDYDTVDTSDPLPAHPGRRPDLFAAPPTEVEPKPEPPAHGISATSSSRPALCVQVREGRLHVFLPPTQTLPNYLDLVAAIEDTSAHLRMPVWVEGYTPPNDPRLQVLKVTPDPGVIEVNVPPARTWYELVDTTSTVYEEARQTRLTAEKFMLDGKHSGTGGGNHIVIGGPSVDDSPLLRKPHLLRSLVTFWQNHPSLSYLFSGTFIGPTSQHPRVDEARMDSLYELEIAFNQLPSGPCPPWIVDRLFRNLLVDMTGNTHRAEFCMDKLFPPENQGSRLGLLEIRSFEMTPHWRMDLAQRLLVRALISVFWKKPYQNGLVRWETVLHDRFLLPYFVQQDFDEALDELRRGGYAFENDWFIPHFEFRFPKIGHISSEGILLELRQALEPWHVLGEEATQSGVSRSVDSSLERLQVLVKGFNPARFRIACNGRNVPLQPTGTPGDYVAGVRYRAWQPPFCLHPTIPVHTPLVFDIVDTWNGFSVGGCRYHVAHPGGRNYETRPVNAYEAEGRRVARFEEHGHTPGKMRIADEERNPNFPMTLDLRRAAPGPTPK
jgi:uncharacterized protein (DUF2126 family)